MCENKHSLIKIKKLGQIGFNKDYILSACLFSLDMEENSSS